MAMNRENLTGNLVVLCTIALMLSIVTGAPLESFVAVAVVRGVYEVLQWFRY